MCIVFICIMAHLNAFDVIKFADMEVKLDDQIIPGLQ